MRRTSTSLLLMYRRSLVVLMGAPPVRKRPTVPTVHASQRPPAEATIDFSVLGLEFPLQFTPQFVVARKAWSPKPETTPDLPFQVERTHVGDSLPVYTDFKGGRTKIVTILRKIKGDIPKLKIEMEKVVGKEVQIKPGKLVVDGNYHRRLKVWLTGLGF
jgi:large subunit ribosomal protein L49